MSYETLASGIVRIALGPVNAYAVSEPDGRWFLVDTGFPGGAEKVHDGTRDALGPPKPPAFIILTHAHFDHAGSARDLARTWNVPVLVHRLEHVFTQGRDFPPPDPTVGGALALFTRLHHGLSSTFVGEAARVLDDDGTLPDFPAWKWLHTPGHTPGHVSLWRERDRSLIAGDACLTLNSDSAIAHLIHARRVCRPGAPTTYDWELARRSVATIAALKPCSLACGHGEPIVGPDAAQGLAHLARTFQAPASGRYVSEPVQFAADGPTRIPPPVSDPLPGRLAMAGLGFTAAVLGWKLLRYAGA